MGIRLTVMRNWSLATADAGQTPIPQAVGSSPGSYLGSYLLTTGIAPFFSCAPEALHRDVVAWAVSLGPSKLLNVDTKTQRRSRARP